MSVQSLVDVHAPAKLNLFLHVIGRRSDGYHLLESVFVLIDWCDTLHFERRHDGLLQRHDLTEALPADDLCLRAARALQLASGTHWGADISIEKRIPSGAGMGGGSSDAASVLLALNRLWGLNWPRSRLLSIAQTLGADVPFFVFGSHAFVQGIGERLSEIALPPLAFAVVKPKASLPTASIFGSELLKRDTPSAILMGSFESAPSASWLASFAAELAESRFGWGRNDLQPPAEASCREVLLACQWLESQFGNSRMTGSGSAVFSKVGSVDATLATWPSGTSQQVPDGWVAKLCRSLPEHPLRAWAG
jgi:4-diphosphocytidyl-2-C-methyl-D-erythritol kinase